MLTLAFATANAPQKGLFYNTLSYVTSRLITKQLRTFAKTQPMKIAIGNDHAGPDYKKAIVEKLKALGHEVTNYGTDAAESVDYPDFGHPVAQDVSEGKADFGIVICGTGNGIAMAANQHKGVRAAVCWTKEIADLCRRHNDANIISVPARFTSVPQAVEMVEVFINTEFEGGRHATRVNKIACI